MDLQKLKGLQAVVFDMDGLMFDSERYVQKSWDIAGEILGYGPLGHNIVNTLGMNRTNREIYFKGHYGQEFPFEKFMDTYRNAYNEMTQKDGVPVKEGVHKLLKLLKRHEIKMAVATSSSQEHAFGNLDREGIRDYFHTVVTGNMVKHGKPEPEIYVTACKELDVDPHNAIALEDAANGIRAAFRAGMMPVIIPDLVKDTSLVDNLLFGKYKSLLDFAKELEKNLWKE